MSQNVGHVLECRACPRKRIACPRMYDLSQNYGRTCPRTKDMSQTVGHVPEGRTCQARDSLVFMSVCLSAGLPLLQLASQLASIGSSERFLSKLLLQLLAPPPPTLQAAPTTERYACLCT